MKDCKLSQNVTLLLLNHVLKSDLSNLDFLDEVHVNEHSVKVLSLYVT